MWAHSRLSWGVSVCLSEMLSEKKTCLRQTVDCRLSPPRWTAEITGISRLIAPCANQLWDLLLSDLKVTDPHKNTGAESSRTLRDWTGPHRQHEADTRRLHSAGEHQLYQLYEPTTRWCDLWWSDLQQLRSIKLKSDKWSSVRRRFSPTVLLNVGW